MESRSDTIISGLGELKTVMYETRDKVIVLDTNFTTFKKAQEKTNEDTAGEIKTIKGYASNVFKVIGLGVVGTVLYRVLGIRI